jgi:predicted RNA-binding protein with TRAM domain
LCTSDVEETRNTCQITVPKLEVGNRSAGSIYKMAVLLYDDGADETEETIPSQPTEAAPQPPVAEGETRAVEIEGLGEQGNGVARVDRGFVVIVPETEVGERVRINIKDV